MDDNRDVAILVLLRSGHLDLVAYLILRCRDERRGRSDNRWTTRGPFARYGALAEQ